MSKSHRTQGLGLSFATVNGSGRSRLAATTALALAIAFLSTHGAQAQVVWDGDTSNDVLDATNWVGDLLPTPGQNVVLNNGALANRPILGVGDVVNVRTVGVSAGTATVDGEVNTTNGMRATGTGTIQISATGTVNGNFTNAGGTVTVTAGANLDRFRQDGGTTNSAGLIVGTLDVNASGMTNSGNVNGAVTVDGGTLVNDGTLGNVAADTVTVGATGQLDNSATGVVRGTVLNDNQVNNQGSVGAAVHNGGTFTNDGQIKRDLDVNDNGFTNNAAGTVDGNVTVDTGIMTNDGTLGNAATDTVAVANGATLNTSGTIKGTLTALGTATNTGTVRAAVVGGGVGTLTNNNLITHTLTVDSGTAENNGDVNGNTVVNGGMVENTGRLGNAVGDTTTVALTGALNNKAAGVIAGTLTNQGIVTNEGQMRDVVHDGGTFSNTGVITGTLDVNSNGLTNEVAGKVKGNVTVDTALLVNNGTLGNAATDTVTVGLTGDLTNALGGKIKGTVLNQGDVSNAGNINSVIHNGSTFSNTGVIADTLNVNTDGFTNAAGAQVRGNVVIGAATLINQGQLGNAPTDTVSLVGLSQLDNQSGAAVNGEVINNGGVVNNALGGSLTTVTNNAGQTNNRGNVTGQTTIANGTVTNFGTGELTTVSQSGGILDNFGSVSGASTVTGGDFNNSGSTVGLVSNNGGTVNNLVAGQMAALTNISGDTFNSGSISGTATVQGGLLRNELGGQVATVVQSNGNVQNVGTVTGTAMVTGGTYDNSGSTNGLLTNNGGTVNNLVGGQMAALTNISGDTFNSGSISGTATVQGGLLRNELGGQVATVVQSNGNVQNVGTVTGIAMVTGGTYDNSGSTNGLLTNNGGTVNNLAGGTLASVQNDNGITTNFNVVSGAVGVSNGTFDNRAGADVNGLVTNNGGIVTNAAGAEIQALVNNNGTTTNSGSVITNTDVHGGTVNHGGTIGGNAFVDGGQLNVVGGSVTGTTTNDGGVIDISNGTFTAGLFNISGTVEAEGNIVGDIENRAAFRASANILGNGANRFTNTGSGTVDLRTASLTAFSDFANAGIVDVGAAQTLAATTISNSNRINLVNGSIAGAFSNTGTLAVSGVGNITGTFANDGTVDLQDGLSFADTLNISGLTSGNGTYQLDLDLTTGNMDLVNANGGTAGSVLLQFTTIGGGTILPAKTVFSGLSAGTTYNSNGLPVGGAILYSLQNNGGNLQIASGVNPAVPGVAASAAMTQSLIGTVVNRPTSPFVSGLAAEEACSHGGYFRGAAGVATVTGNTSSSAGNNSTDISSSFYGVQGGYDIGCFDGRFGGWDLAAGFMLGYNAGSTKQGIFSDPINPAIQTGISGSDFEQTYAGLYMAGSKDRFSGDLQLRYDNTKFDLTEVALPGFAGSEIGLDGLSYGTQTSTVGARVNYRLDVNEEKGINFIPTLGFNYSSTTGALLTLDANGPGLADDETLEIVPFNTVVGFIGGTLAKTSISDEGDSATTTFVSANYYQDFGGDRNAIYDSPALPAAETMTIGSIGGFAEASVGLNYVKILDKGPGGAKQLNASLRADARFGESVKDSVSLTAQLRLSF